MSEFYTLGVCALFCCMAIPKTFLSFGAILHVILTFCRVIHLYLKMHPK